MVIKLSAGAIAVSVCLSLAFFAGHGQPVLADGGGGKKHDVADTVKKEVAMSIKKNPRIGAALVRLLFHDCWVHVRMHKQSHDPTNLHAVLPSMTDVGLSIHACTFA